MQFSVRYILLFSAAICGVCAVFVSSLAVGLSERQEINQVLEKKRNVLEAAGMMKVGEGLSAEEIEKRFSAVRSVVIDLDTGEVQPDIDPETFDQQKAKKDPARSTEAPKNAASVFRLPNNALIYQVLDDSGNIEKLVLPIEGYGLWSTLYGFIALGSDSRTVEGLTFYQHGETPGLGGEVDNPRWKAHWPGRKAFDENWNVKLEVIKGAAPPPAEAPYKVDGLSGATITARGVTNMVRFWLGENGFGPYLEKYRQERRAA